MAHLSKFGESFPSLGIKCSFLHQSQTFPYPTAMWLSCYRYRSSSAIGVAFRFRSLTSKEANGKHTCASPCLQNCSAHGTFSSARLRRDESTAMTVRKSGIMPATARNDFHVGTCKCGMGRPAKRWRHGLPRSRTHLPERDTRALSVAIPVSAYI